MSPSLVEEPLVDPPAAPSQPPSKRPKLEHAPPAKAENQHDIEGGGSDGAAASTAAEIPPHPLRIKPAGNAFTATTNLRDTSIGRFAMLHDELILHILGYLEAPELLAIGAASKGFFGFTRSEELWKALFIGSQLPNSSFIWRGSWNRTCRNLPASSEAKICLSNLFSDVLYRPYHMSQLPLAPYTTNIPLQNQILRFPSLPEESFTTYSGTPFVLTEPAKSWPGYATWSLDYLLARYGDGKFRAESVEWPLRTYVSYMHDQNDESPLYLFDKDFIKKTQREMEFGFTVPACFGRDYFEALGAQRPDHRWMILGPKRSGSTFHKDPNATSAWNAVIFGEKYWIMFPPSSPPPGVFVSKDQSEVTSPLSIAEWLVSFHKLARSTPGCVEGICKAGEVLHVPSGWWHLVVSTQDSLALTQNFVPKEKLPAVLQFLDEQRCSVSGFAKEVETPYELFVERMKVRFPSELEEALRELERKRRSEWDKLVQGGRCFAFGFGGDESDDE